MASPGPLGKAREPALRIRGEHLPMAPRASCSTGAQASSTRLGSQLVGAGFPAQLPGALCHSSEEQVTPLTSEHRHVTSAHHMKYFHGGQQDLGLEVPFLLAGGVLWRSLKSHPELRQQPHDHHVHSVPTGSLAWPACWHHICWECGLPTAHHVPFSKALPSAGQVATSRR